MTARGAKASLERSVWEALREIDDPCSVRNRTPLNLLEMGIVEQVSVGEEGDVVVTMLLTDPGCVFFFEMGREIKERVAVLDGVRAVEVRSIGDRWWEPERMTPAARRRLAQMRAARDGRSRKVALAAAVGASRGSGS